GIAGNVMEWYDFSIYGFFARTIGQQFFPTHDLNVSLMAAFGTFAVGFFMRPLGAIVFGYIGDRVGRAHSLLWSVVVMAIPTFAIGLLPTYHQIGIAASVLMLLCRILQGLAVGGEYTGSIVFLAERALPRKRGLVCGWAPFGSAGGILLGSAMGPWSSIQCPWRMSSAGAGACPSYSASWWGPWDTSSAGMSPSTSRPRARAFP
ncbi:MAG TPA: MFS transporter, partial [Dongiaceae bacterium]|nr:MFS transporter [Dongiaceae bacterium]